MASHFDLTTEHGLSAYLTSHPIPHTSVALLTGGTANYVYRVTLPSGETVIYKHAAPYLHSNTSFAFDPSRMDYEHRILELVPTLMPKQSEEPTVYAVGVKSYDKPNKLLGLSDGGPRNLKDAYTDPNLDIPAIGAALGRWLATLHTSSVSTPLSLDPNDKSLESNNAIAVYIYRHSYNNLASAFAAYGPEKTKEGGEEGTQAADADDDLTLATHINTTYGSLLATDNEAICHGDFWPGNILVDNTDPTPKAKKAKTSLTVSDWELTRRGTTATDVAQFLAEAYLLDTFKSDPTNTSRRLAPSFLNAYLTARGTTPDREWFRRLSIHWGVHIAFWPTRVAWAGSREGTRELVEVGRKVLRAAVGGEWGVLFGDGDGRGGECAPLFRGVEEKFREALLAG